MEDLEQCLSRAKSCVAAIYQSEHLQKGFMFIFCVRLLTCTTCLPEALIGQKRELDPLDLQLQVVVSQLSTGN